MSTASRTGRTARAALSALLLLTACDSASSPAAPPAAPASPTTTNPTGEPVFPGAGPSLLWADDFESHDDNRSLFARYITQNGESGLHLDRSGGVGGSRALRVDWRAKSGCADDSHLIEAAFPRAAREVVVQYSVRYSPKFVFDWTGRRGACTGNAKKMFFLWAAKGSRFAFIVENHKIGIGSDQDHPLFTPHLNGAFTPEQLGDGKWHRITLRVRQSSAPTTTDGSLEGWVDGVRRWSVPAVASHASGGWVLFKMPTTFNQGSPVDQSEWIDDLKIWTP